MYRSLILIIFVVSYCLSACTKHKDVHKKTRNVSKMDYHMDIIVPTGWIEKVRKYDPNQNNAQLLSEFDRFIKPDSIFIPAYDKDLDKKQPGLLNALFVNLDNDESEELIITLGWNKNHPSMAVFKKIGSDWHLLYLEDYYMFYNMPDLSVANSYSVNKTFYFRRVYNRGSGVYSDGYSFYKLVGNKVYPCLALINEAHIVGWGLYMNQEVSSKFNFTDSEGDYLWVKYIYNFFPGPIYEKDFDWDSNNDISLIKGENAVGYKWNDKTFKYELDNSSTKTEVEELNAAKISCFGDFANDSLFVHAFGAEIEQILKTGTSKQKKIMEEYLARVKKNKTVAAQ